MLDLLNRNKNYDKSLILPAICFVTGDSTIRITYSYALHLGVRVSVMSPGDAKWIYILLPVPKGSLIKDVTIVYHCTGFQCSIVSIR